MAARPMIGVDLRTTAVPARDKLTRSRALSTQGGNMTAGCAAAIVQAFKASGVIVRIEPGEFSKLINRASDPLIVVMVRSSARTTNI
jgi:hypothetical protein